MPDDSSLQVDSRPSQLAWSEGWGFYRQRSTFITWSWWTLTVTLSLWQHHKYHPKYHYQLQQTSMPGSHSIHGRIWLHTEIANNLQTVTAITIHLSQHILGDKWHACITFKKHHVVNQTNAYATTPSKHTEQGVCLSRDKFFSSRSDQSKTKYSRIKEGRRKGKEKGRERNGRKHHRNNFLVMDLYTMLKIYPFHTQSPPDWLYGLASGSVGVVVEG